MLTPRTNLFLRLPWFRRAGIPVCRRQLRAEWAISPRNDSKCVR